MTARAGELLALFTSRRAAMIADLEALVSHESPSDAPALVSALAGWVARRLSGSAVRAETVPCPPRGDSVVAGSGSGPGGTLLLGHLDTVFPAGTLDANPFRVEGSVAKGPGVFDMKGGIAVALALFDAVREGAVRPAAPVTLCLTSDEEVGSRASRELLLGLAVARERVLVLEPSAAGGAAKVARKGVGLVSARFRGVAAHAGLEPEKGASALLEMARFAIYADALGDAALGTSVVCGTASAGSRTNVVPECAQLAIDLRAWTPAEAERVLSSLHAYAPQDARVVVEVEGGLNRPPMEPTPASLALHASAARAAAALGLSLEAHRVGGGSDGNFTAAAGVPTLDGLGPAGHGAHGRDERLDVDDLPRRAALLALMLEEGA